MVPHKLSVGSPEVTAKVDELKDLATVPDGWFDVPPPSGGTALLRFAVVGRTNLTQDVVGGAPALTWPELPGTRVDGVIWVDLVLDKDGHIRQPFSMISDNPALNDLVHEYLAKLQFKPVLVNGQPVQTVRHVVLHFNLGQPAKLDQELPRNDAD